MIDKAISELYTDKLFISMCKRFGKDNHEDLRGVVIMIFLEMPIKMIENIITQEYLLPYALKTVRTQVANKWSIYNKLYNHKNEPLTEYIELTLTFDPDEPNRIEEKHKIAVKTIAKINEDSLNQSNPHFYHSHLALHRPKHRSTKALAKETGIPYRGMQTALKEYEKYLKEWAQES